jgi:hypothetical protein
MAKSTASRILPKMPGVGRQAGQSLDPHREDEFSWVEVDVDDRWRVRLPPDFISHSLGNSQEKAIDLLCSMRDGGVAGLYPWTPNGDAVIEEVRRLTARAPEDRKVAATVRDAYFKYARLTLGKDSRMTLPPQVLLHLQISETNNRSLLLIAYLGLLELWTRGARERHTGNPDVALARLAP